MSEYRSFYVKSDVEVYNTTDLCRLLQSNNVKSVIKGLENILMRDDIKSISEQIFMPVLKYAGAQKDHYLVKLVHLFFSCIPNLGESEIIILVCQLIRNQLTSSNEYIRGSCLKSLCRFNAPKIISAVRELIINSLQDDYEYVRKSACFAIRVLVSKYCIEGFDDELKPFLIHIINFDECFSVRSSALLCLLSIDPLSLYINVFETSSFYLPGNEQYSRTLVQCIGELIQYIDDIPCDKSNIMYNYTINNSVNLYADEKMNKYLNTKSLLTEYVSIELLIARLLYILQYSKYNAVLLDTCRYCIWLSSNVEHLNLVFITLLRILNSCNNNIVKNYILEILLELTRTNKNVAKLHYQKLFTINSTYSTHAHSKLLQLLLSIDDVDKQLVITSHIFDLLSNIKNLKDTSEIDVLNITYLRTIYKTYGILNKTVIFGLINLISIIPSYNLMLLIREIVLCIKLKEKSCDQIDEEQWNTITILLIDQLMKFDKKISQNIFSQLNYTLVSIIFNELQRDYYVNILFDALQPLPLTKKRTSKENNNIAKTIIKDDGSYGTIILNQNVYNSKVERSNIREVISNTANAYLILNLSISLVKVLINGKLFINQPINAICYNKSIAILLSLLQLIELDELLGKTSTIYFKIQRCLQILFEKKNILLNNDDSTSLLCIEREREYMKNDIRLNNNNGNKTELEAISYFNTYCGNQKFNPSFNKIKAISDNNERNNNINQITWHSWSGFSDEIYVELSSNFIDYDLHITINIHNCTQKAIENLDCTIITDNNQKYTSSCNSTIKQSDNHLMNFIIKLTDSDINKLFGYIMYIKTGDSTRNCIKLEPFAIDNHQLLNYDFININEFRNQWEIFDWEKRLSLAFYNTQDLKNMLTKFLEQTKGTVIGIKNDFNIYNAIIANKQHCSPQQQSQDYIKAILNDENILLLLQNDCIIINLKLQLKQCECALMNLALEKRNKNVHATVKIRAKKEKIVIKIGELLTSIEMSYNETVKQIT